MLALGSRGLGICSRDQLYLRNTWLWGEWQTPRVHQSQPETWTLGPHQDLQGLTKADKLPGDFMSLEIGPIQHMVNTRSIE